MYSYIFNITISLYFFKPSILDPLPNDNRSEILLKENKDILAMLQDQDMQNEDDKSSISSLLEDNYNYSEGFISASQMYIVTSIPIANTSKFGESSNSWNVNSANSGDNR
ncbi:14335_t:CDS:2, partial [Dentiscutata erythropus]